MNSRLLVKRSKDEDGNPVVIVADWYWKEHQELIEKFRVENIDLIHKLKDRDETIRELAQALEVAGIMVNLASIRKRIHGALRKHASQIQQAKETQS